MCENQLASQPLYRNIDYTTRNAEQLWFCPPHPGHSRIALPASLEWWTSGHRELWHAIILFLVFCYLFKNDWQWFSCLFFGCCAPATVRSTLIVWRRETKEIWEKLRKDRHSEEKELFAPVKSLGREDFEWFESVPPKIPWPARPWLRGDRPHLRRRLDRDRRSCSCRQVGLWLSWRVSSFARDSAPPIRDPPWWARNLV